MKMIEANIEVAVKKSGSKGPKGGSKGSNPHGPAKGAKTKRAVVKVDLLAKLRSAMDEAGITGLMVTGDSVVAPVWGSNDADMKAVANFRKLGDLGKTLGLNLQKAGPGALRNEKAPDGYHSTGFIFSRVT